MRDAVVVEVVERVPVADDRNIEIAVLAARPEAEPYDQSERDRPLRRGLRWRITVAGAAESSLELRYRITVPAKHEIIGGNRRV